MVPLMNGNMRDLMKGGNGENSDEEENGLGKK
jgi:hypothetical protein